MILRIFFTLLLMASFFTQDIKSVVFPPSLQPGDKIAILAPAGHVKKDYVDVSADILRELGYEPVVYPSCYLHNGQFSGTIEERFRDMKDAFLNPEIKAILCARGGYGVVHNLDSLAALPLGSNPKWVIGFSDISALHSLLASKGIASIHASMTQHLSKGADLEENAVLLDILKGNFPSYTFEAHPYNHTGKAEGRLLGGNLSVIQALIGTPYNIIKPGTILFIEDVSEPIYKVERMLYQLKLAGIFPKLKGLIIGRFTEYKADSNHKTMEEMISGVLKDYPDLPVAFNVPVGHVSHNLPLVESSRAVLTVSPDSVTLEMRK